MTTDVSSLLHNIIPIMDTTIIITPNITIIIMTTFARMLSSVVRMLSFSVFIAASNLLVMKIDENHDNVDNGGDDRNHDHHQDTSFEF